MAGNKRWTQKEIVILQDKYGKIPIEDLTIKLGRTKDSIHYKASKLGIEFNPNGIADLNTRLTNIELKLNLILNHMSIVNTEKTNAKWTDDKLNFIKDNYSTMSRKEIANHFSTTTNVINQLFSKLEIKGKSTKVPLSESDKEYIKKNYLKMTYRLIAKKLNVPLTRVCIFISYSIQKGELKPKNPKNLL